MSDDMTWAHLSDGRHPPYTTYAQRMILTPDVLTDAIILPAGTFLATMVKVIRVTDWDGGATIDVGDEDDPDGWMAAWDAVTGRDPYINDNQPVGYMVDDSAYAYNEAGQGPAYFNFDDLYAGFKSYYPDGGTITATVTATDPTVGETIILVVSTTPI